MRSSRARVGGLRETQGSDRFSTKSSLVHGIVVAIRCERRRRRRRVKTFGSCGPCAPVRACACLCVPAPAAACPPLLV
eukprot:4250373-Prymnesium_polylepis.1